MKGLILKDLLSMKKQFRIYAILSVGYLVLALYMKSPYTVASMLCMLGILYSLDAFEQEAREIAACGPDAAIVQDLGAAKLLREVCPALPLHASTQMSIHNAAGVNALERLGIRRVVLARYLVALGVFAVAVAGYFIVNLLLPLFPEAQAAAPDIKALSALGLSVMLVLEALLLPLLYRFGGNSRMYVLVILAVFFGLFYAGGRFDVLEAMWPFIRRLPWVLLALGSAALVPSYFLSVKLYSQKDF